jgi:hypothetical protein
VHDAFELIDADDNGFVSMKEFKAVVLQTMAVEDEASGVHHGADADELILASLAPLDKDKDTRVDYSEFLAMWRLADRDNSMRAFLDSEKAASAAERATLSASTSEHKGNSSSSSASSSAGSTSPKSSTRTSTRTSFSAASVTSVSAKKPVASSTTPNQKQQQQKKTVKQVRQQQQQPPKQLFVKPLAAKPVDLTAAGSSECV